MAKNTRINVKYMDSADKAHDTEIERDAQKATRRLSGSPAGPGRLLNGTILVLPWQAWGMRPVAGLLLTVALIAGCGGDNESGETTAAPTTTTAAPTTTTAAPTTTTAAPTTTTAAPTTTTAAPTTLIAFAAFVCHGDDCLEIFVMNSDGTEVRQLTDNDDWDDNPVWSPDGKRIAFDSDRDSDRDDCLEIFVMNSDGTEVRQLTDNDSADGFPAWSPDGKRIAFDSDRDGDWEIFVMNADGTQARQLTNNNDFNVEPAWSPDGKRIAFDSNRDGDLEIFVMNADGTQVRQLTDNDDTDISPVWSPDGKRIAFNRDTVPLNKDPYGIMEIIVMNADGTDAYSTGPGGFVPSWGG